MNAIIIGFAGRIKMVQMQQGLNPFATTTNSQPPAKANGRYVPPPSQLPPLTPEAFDAMFPGKQV